MIYTINLIAIGMQHYLWYANIDASVLLLWNQLQTVKHSQQTVNWSQQIVNDHSKDCQPIIIQIVISDNLSWPMIVLELGGPAGAFLIAVISLTFHKQFLCFFTAYSEMILNGCDSMINRYHNWPHSNMINKYN